MFIFVKQAKIVEVIDNKRVYQDFFYVIEKTTFTFVKICKLTLKIVINHEVQLIFIIDKFRHHMHMKKARKIEKSSSRSSNRSRNRSNNHTFSFKKKSEIKNN